MSPPAGGGGRQAGAWGKEERMSPASAGGAAWRARPSGPDGGLSRTAACRPKKSGKEERREKPGLRRRQGMQDSNLRCEGQNLMPFRLADPLCLWVGLVRAVIPLYPSLERPPNFPPPPPAGEGVGPVGCSPPPLRAHVPPRPKPCGRVDRHPPSAPGTPLYMVCMPCILLHLRA